MPFDPDFGKADFARHRFSLRFRRLKLSQREFSERFALSYSVVRDAEQGARPTRSLRLIVADIGGLLSQPKTWKPPREIGERRKPWTKS